MSKDKGKKRIEWVSKHMPILNSVRSTLLEEKPFTGLTIGICLHIETKTGYLIEVLKDCGADVIVCGSNPLSTKDDIVEAVRDYGATIYSSSNMSEEEYTENIKKVANHKLDLVIDDGADLVAYLIKSGLYKNYDILGSTEETTTGIVRLHDFEKKYGLPFPVIAVNDTPMKCMFDNRFGTAQSTLFAIFKLTNMSLSGKTIVVAGYGWCGKGLASRAKAIGAIVIVCEVNPIKASEAIMDGFRVMKMEDASEIGDIFITATGCKDVITEKHFLRMKNGAVLANSGHFNNEISVSGLENVSSYSIKNDEFMTTYIVNNKEVVLLTEGRLVNLVGGEGHPIEIIDLSFSLQLLSILYLVENNQELEKKLLQVPEEIDKKIAEYNLKANNVYIDTLTLEQCQYLGQ